MSQLCKFKNPDIFIICRSGIPFGIRPCPKRRHTIGPHLLGYWFLLTLKRGKTPIDKTGRRRAIYSRTSFPSTSSIVPGCYCAGTFRFPLTHILTIGNTVQGETNYYSTSFFFYSGPWTVSGQQDCHLSRSCATVVESSRLQNPQSQSRRVVARILKSVSGDRWCYGYKRCG